MLRVSGVGLAVQARSWSLFTVDRLLSVQVTHQNEFHQHHLVVEPLNLTVAPHSWRVMRYDRVDVACAVRILGL